MNVKATHCGADTGKQALADRQRATLRAAYDRVRNLPAALSFLALAELRGFSHLEKIFAADGTITELRPVEQWFWVRDGLRGPWQYNAGAHIGTKSGTPVQPERFIIREIDDPLDELMAKHHLRSEKADAGWAGHLENFGIPAIVIEGPPNVPREKEKEYQATAESISAQARGYVPHGTNIHTVAGYTGKSVLKPRLEYLNRQLALAGTGAQLAILTEGGTGNLAAAHAAAFNDMADALAQDISGVMNDNFDQDVIARLHPGEPPLAYFEFAPRANDGGCKVLNDAVKAKSAGYSMDIGELSNATGYRLTSNGGPPARPLQAH